jgi:hypothetical protein
MRAGSGRAADELQQLGWGGAIHIAESSHSVTAPTDSAALVALEAAPQSRFADRPALSAPVGAGIYTVWRGTQFLYVGVAGRPAGGGGISLKSRGLRGRLDSHASGRRSGDQFCVYVCDRLVLPTIERRLHEVADGSLSLDLLTQNFVRAELSYRCLETDDYGRAIRLENQIKRSGLPNAGKPLLNPDAKPD